MGRLRVGGLRAAHSSVPVWGGKMVYLTTHSTHFSYGYMRNDKLVDQDYIHTRVNTLYLGLNIYSSKCTLYTKASLLQWN